MKIVSYLIKLGYEYLAGSFGCCWTFSANWSVCQGWCCVAPSQ